MRMVARPQIVTTAVGGSCYAYIAYDTSYTSTLDGHSYFTADLDVWNVTDDANPVWVTEYVSKNGASTAYNDFGHEVAAAGPYVAWGYYSQILSPCATDFEIYEDGNGALTSINNRFSPPVSGYFPSLRPSLTQVGLLDWVQGISRGVGPGGQLFLSWAEPVCMDSGHSCTACNVDGCPSGQWSIVEKGVVVTP